MRLIECFHLILKYIVSIIALQRQSTAYYQYRQYYPHPKLFSADTYTNKQITNIHKYTINKYTNHRRFPHYPHPESLSADDNALKNLIDETDGIFDGPDFSQIGLQKY